MKTMNCKQLGGVCNKEFHANTFDEMAELSKKHGTEMYKKGDAKHLKAMQEMMELMKDPRAMKKWFESKQKEFAALPEDKQYVHSIYKRQKNGRIEKEKKQVGSQYHYH